MKLINLQRMALMFLFLGFLAAPITSCSSDDPEEPPITSPDPDPDPDPEPDPDPDPDPDPEVSSTSILRLNSGGPEVAFGDVIFLEDTYFSDGNSEPFTNPEVTEIAETDQDEIYLTERISSAIRGTYSYDIPVTNGDYRVILHFAEIFWGQPGAGVAGGDNSRIFDVSVEGTTVLDNYDLFADVGGATATTKTFIVTVTDEELNIVLSATTDYPKLSAIELEGDGAVRN